MRLRAVVWIKIIDVHSGVIIDIEQFGLGDVSGLATNITQLISKAAPGGKPRQFIALRPLVDMNRDASFEGADWPGRLTSLIEKHFMRPAMAWWNLPPSCLSSKNAGWNQSD